MLYVCKKWYIQLPWIQFDVAIKDGFNKLLLLVARGWSVYFSLCQDRTLQER